MGERTWIDISEPASETIREFVVFFVTMRALKEEKVSMKAKEKSDVDRSSPRILVSSRDDAVKKRSVAVGGEKSSSIGSFSFTLQNIDFQA